MEHHPLRAILLMLPLLAATAAEDAAADLAPLRERVDAIPLLREDGERLLWGSPDGEAFAVIAPAREGALVTSDAGPVAIAGDLFAREDAALATTLADLVARAHAAGLEASREQPFAFQDSILLGPRLRLADAVVSGFGVLRQEPDLAPRPPQELRRPLAPAVKRVLATVLAESGRDELAKRAMTTALQRLLQEEGTTGEEFYTPRFIRRIVRHGWLTRILPDQPAAAELTELVRRIATPRPVWRYRDAEDTVRVEQLANAFGVGGYILRTPDLLRLNAPFPVPEFYWPHHAGRDRPGIDQRASVVLDLEPDVAFLARDADLAGRLRAARIVHAGEVLCSWTRDGGLRADPERWREVVPDRGQSRRLDRNALHGIMPPHIPVVDLLGDIDGIITEKGILVPPRDGSREEAERFLADASELLPDAAHLELIGEYCFQYVFDSPDPTERRIIGSFKDKGDIHQTAHQTLATVAGGIFRGDCDDLSELYEHVLERQGKTAHIISLPSHAAVGWAEERGDGWHVFVLQTGPAKEFVDRQLQRALARAYKSFGADEAFDPNGLGLLLRFSGENTRSAWRLSYRIFSEPEYAETMINVQRDWHFQTYLQGIEKMERMIAGGDEDTANYRELSGLFNFTGQYAKAAEYHQMAIERTAEPDSRLFMRVEQVGHLLKAEREEDALRLAEEILSTDLPALRGRLGLVELQIGRMLASYLQDEGEFELAAVALHDTSIHHVKRPVTALAMYVDSDQFDQRRWQGSSEMQKYRRVGRQFAYASLGLLQDGGAERLEQIPEMRSCLAVAQRWFDDLAFHDADDDSDILRTYGALGRMYAAILGRDDLLERLAAVDAPRSSTFDHTVRAGGLAQLPGDLPWIKVSVFFWGGLLDQLSDPDRETLNREAALRVADGLEAAVAASAELGMTGAGAKKYAHRTRLVAALLREDAAAVRSLLAEMAALNDKRLRDDCTQAIGDKARFLDDAWFDRVVQIWIEEVNYKPKYLWIAWRAALGHAPAKALRVAKIAAERFADDQAFVDEYRFMRELLE